MELVKGIYNGQMGGGMQDMMKKIIGGMGGGEVHADVMENLKSLAQQIMGGGTAGKINMPPGCPKA